MGISSIAVFPDARLLIEMSFLDFSLKIVRKLMIADILFLFKKCNIFQDLMI